MYEDFPLVDGEREVFDGDEMAMRSVRDDRIAHDGTIGGDIFELSSADGGRSSCALRSGCTPEQHRAERETLRPGSCAAIAQLLVSEINEVQLRLVDDSALTSTITAHSYIDWRPFTASDGKVAKNRRREMRIRLARFANVRGVIRFDAPR